MSKSIFYFLLSETMICVCLYHSSIQCNEVKEIQIFPLSESKVRYKYHLFSLPLCPKLWFAFFSHHTIIQYSEGKQIQIFPLSESIVYFWFSLFFCPKLWFSSIYSLINCNIFYAQVTNLCPKAKKWMRSESWDIERGKHDLTNKTWKLFRWHIVMRITWLYRKHSCWFVNSFFNALQWAKLLSFIKICRWKTLLSHSLIQLMSNGDVKYLTKIV